MPKNAPKLRVNVSATPKKKTKTLHHRRLGTYCWVERRCRDNLDSKVLRYPSQVDLTSHLGRRLCLRRKLLGKAQKSPLHTCQPRLVSELSMLKGSRQSSHTIACSPCLVKMYRWCTRPYKSSADASTIETSGIFALSSSSQNMKLVSDPQGTLDIAANLPGSTSSTMSIASFQNGTIEFSPVRLKSSSIKSSATSQKYSCPGKEQNQEIHVRVEVGVDEAERGREERVEFETDGTSYSNPRRDNRSENERPGQLFALRHHERRR